MLDPAVKPIRIEGSYSQKLARMIIADFLRKLSIRIFFIRIIMSIL